MTLAIEHPLAVMLDDAAAGFFPQADGRVDVFAAPSGPCDVVIAFSGHAVIAGDVDPAWVRQHVQHGWYGEHDHHPAIGPHFIAALSERLGSPPAGISMLLAAAPIAPECAGELHPGRHEASSWSDYRTDVRDFDYRGYSGSGSISIGRGPAGRWDVWIGHSSIPGPRSATLRGRELLATAKTLVPAGSPLYASVPIHSARSIRMSLAAGFRPLGAEVLFCTRAEE